MIYPEIEQYIQNPTKENRDKLHEVIGDERFKVSELGITSRVFTHWRHNGLIPEFEGRKWIRLNLIEYFWIQIIKDLRDRGLGILLTDHNVRETLSITDRAYLMADGRILLSGTADDLINDAEARKIYLGDKFRM